MRDQRYLLDIPMAKNEPDRGFQLLRGILGNAQRRIVRRGPVHFRIAAGMAEAIEIERPDVEAGAA
jgi:hypothetical protein